MDASVNNPQPIDESVAEGQIAGDARPHSWSLGKRIAFRIAFCYFGIFCVSNLLYVVPFLGAPTADWLQNLFFYPAPYLAQHVFHVPPPGDSFHNTQGAADFALAWIATLVRFVFSLFAATVWSLLDRRRRHYQTLLAWLRFLARLMLALAMANYAMAKIFPTQMPVLHIWTLGGALGMQTPFGLLWALLGSNRLYEITCGCIELLACLLLLARRTALMGAILTAVVMTNVLMFNLFFDVPVKIYAGHLVLLSMLAIVPDAADLTRFFWRHQLAAPTGVWVPPLRRSAFRRVTIVIESVFAIVVLFDATSSAMNRWRPIHAALLAPCPLRGIYRIDSTASEGTHGVPLAQAFQISNTAPLVELDIDTATSAALRDADGALFYFKTRTDVAGGSVTFIRPDKSTVTYSSSVPGPRRLVLAPTGNGADSLPAMKLTLLTPAAGYPLMNRGFHWVNEFPNRSR